ncbi:Replication factor C small subunit [Thermoplasmatales archaeon ex4484_36]|nr:MAG: Replication factor C small subunit [Thermoplasmatales archaeon ex4484_36]
MSWLEKYRPRTLDDVVGQEHIVRILKRVAQSVKSGNTEVLTHYFAAGPPGTGKTTIAYAFFRDAFGEDAPILEINASDETGVDAVRNKVKAFARTAGYSLIILDEVDYMTSNAQAVLRRVMEVYPRTVFYLTCNYPDKVIEPIRQRCLFSRQRFKRLSSAEIRTMLKRILNAEGLEITEEEMDAIVNSSRGNARDAINLLEAFSTSRDGIDSLLSVKATLKLVDGIYEGVMEGSSVKDVERLVVEYFANGGQIPDFCERFMDNLLSDTSLDEDDITLWMHRIADVIYETSVVEYPEILFRAKIIAFMG